MKQEQTPRDLRPAISTIAKALQLSASTVSRALNGVYGVNVETRKRVLAKAEEIGYVPNLGAKQLVGKGSGLVGIFMPEFPSEASNGFVFLLPVLQREMQRIGKDAIFFSMPLSNYSPKRLAYCIGSRDLEACIMLPAFMEQHPLMQEALELGVPCVNFEGAVGPHCSSVLSDDYSGGRMAAQSLLAAGHEQIGHIRGPVGLRTTQERYQGFRAALADRGIDHGPDLVADGDFSGASGGRAIQSLLDRRPDMTAVFCANDLMAAGAIQALAERGIAVPDRISVCGYDGDTYSAYTVPPLTSIRHPRDLCAGHAANMLQELLAGQQGRMERVPPILLDRRSIARACCL